MNNFTPAQDVQVAIEQAYSKKNIKKKILANIDDSPFLLEKIDEGVLALMDFMKQTYYPAKNARLAQLIHVDLEKLIRDILVVILPMERPQLLSSTVGIMAGKLGFSNKRDSAVTIAEIIAVLSKVDLLDLIKEGRYGSIKVRNRFAAPPELMDYIKATKYLPPMVCEPKVLTSNDQTGYLTVKGHLFLGESGNYHEGNICLDHLNRCNQIPLALNVELLKMYPELPKTVLDTKEKKDNWLKMTRDSYEVCTDIVKKGNKFWLTHKPDTRGRTYAQGYHVSTQGNAFRKTIIQFHQKQLVNGV